MMDGSIKLRNDSNAYVRIPRGSYSIRDRRIVRDGDYSPAETGKSFEAVEYETVEAEQPTANSINLKYVTAGIVLSLVGLGGLTMALTGSPDKSPVASRAVSETRQAESGVTKQGQHSSNGVLGAASQTPANNAPAPTPAPVTPSVSTPQRTNKPTSRTAPSPTLVTQPTPAPLAVVTPQPTPPPPTPVPAPVVDPEPLPEPPPAEPLPVEEVPTEPQPNGQ